MKSRILPILDRLRLLDMLVYLRARDIIVIIAYHEVGENEVYWDRGIPVELFRKQIEYLLRLGFEFRNLGDVVELITTGQGRFGRIAVLTFDDGYRGVYLNAYPLMKRLGITGTVFVSGGLMMNKIPIWSSSIAYAIGKLKVPVEIETSSLKIKIRDEIERERVKKELIDKLPELGIEELMELTRVLFDHIGERPEDLYDEIMINIDELRELADQGFEIGAHGYWHLGLPYLSPNQLEEEIKNAKQFTSRYSKTGTLSFAYPYGLYSERVVDELKRHGFSIAVTVRPRCIRKRAINTYDVGRISPIRFGLVDLSVLKYQLVI